MLKLPKRMLENLRVSLCAFGCDIRGNVIMLVAIAVPVIFLAAGGAIDFSRVMALRAKLQDAADIASVGSVAVNSQAYKVSQSVSSGEIKVGSIQAASIFNANVTSQPELGNVDLDAKVVKSGTVLTANVNVTADYKPYMLGLFGFNTLKVAVNSQSSATMPPYIDFYLLLDNSPSMGVGATTADIGTMVSNTPASKYGTANANCAFACHLRNSTTDYYSLAKKLGVTMRIDVVRKATQNLMTTAKKTQTVDGQYRMAIYDFGLAADTIDQKAPQPYLVSGLTSDLTQSATNAAAIDLMIMPQAGYNNDSQTNLMSYLAAMNDTKIISTPGNGMSSSAPQKVLFFVSDGAHDGYDCAYSNGNACRRITPLDITQCAALKARGVRIAVLYTTYLPLPTNDFYNSYLAKYVNAPSKLASQMQACASDGLYFEVSPSQGIDEAMQALFNKVISVVRIRA